MRLEIDFARTTVNDFGKITVRKLGISEILHKPAFQITF